MEHGRQAAVFLAIAVLAAVIVGCAKEEAATQASTQPAAEASGAAVKAAVVTDVGGLGDKGFNALSLAGLRRASEELGVEIEVLESRRAADYASNLTKLAAAGYSPVFAVGYLMTDAVTKLAPQFTDVTFAGVDIVFDPAASLVRLLA